MSKPRIRVPAGRQLAMVGSPSANRDALFAYRAADDASQEMGDWWPQIRSPDAEINQFRDRMVARLRDQRRNDGWMAGALTRILDNTIGSGLKLSATPDYRALALLARGFDNVWAAEYRRVVEAKWRTHCNSYGRWNDVSRQLTNGQQQRLAYAHRLVDGESVVLSYWLPDRVGYGRADYATAFLVIDPDRLSNRYDQPDTRFMRGGVEIDALGVPMAYHVRKAHQNDWYNAVEAQEWERIEAEDEDGWRRVFHGFEHDRAGQNRGVSIFAPVLGHARMLAGYYKTELQAARLAAIYGTYVTSPYDPGQVAEMMGADGDAELSAYQQLRADFHKERPLMVDGVVAPNLAPGEDIKQLAAAHPHSGFADFADEMLAVGAAASGLSLEQYSGKWFRTTYSGGRSGMMEAWKTLIRRRDEFAADTMGPMYATFLHELHERGEVPLPRYAPDFVEARTAYSGARWLGPPRGWYDPVKEPQGAVLKMDGALSTLRDEAADQGQDAEEILDQRQIEYGWFKERGLPVPSWAAMNVGADKAAQPEEEPQPK
jgi:lambda family phage portal protein